MKTNHRLITIFLFTVLLLSGCASRARVGELRNESQAVELGNSQSVRVEINLSAGDLDVTGGAEELLEADFTYNVDRLKPEVQYTNGRLVVRHPEVEGLPALGGITDFRNEWDLRFNNEVPMDLNVEMGAGNIDLQLAGLSMTGLAINLGAGNSTVDLSGDWVHDLDVTIDAGAADLNVQLPREIGVRVEVESGPYTIEATGLTKNEDVYTNAAYGQSEVTVHVNIEAGIGRINLEVEEAAATSD